VAVPTKAELRRFVEIDEWDETRRTDHHRYKKLVDGRILRTRVSMGRGPAFNDPGLWHHVWSKQLDLRSEDEFWETLRTRKPVDRHTQPSAAPPPRSTKPEWLYSFLVRTVGLDHATVLAMSEEEAMQAYHAHIGPQSA